MRPTYRETRGVRRRGGQGNGPPGPDEVRVDVEALVGEAVEVGGQQRRSDRVEVVLGGRAGLEPAGQWLAEVAAEGGGSDVAEVDRDRVAPGGFVQVVRCGVAVG
jgi:hypothetical protein